MANRKISALSDIGLNPSGYVYLPVVDPFEVVNSDKNKYVTVSGLDARYTGYPYFKVDTLSPLTTTTTLGTVLDAFPSGDFDSARYYVKAKRGNEIHTSHINLLQNGVETVITQFGVLYSSGVLASFSGSFSSPSGVLEVFSNSTESTTYNVIRYGDTFS